jgi:hypothetical protein
MRHPQAPMQMPYAMRRAPAQGPGPRHRPRPLTRERPRRQSRAVPGCSRTRPARAACLWRFKRMQRGGRRRRAAGGRQCARGRRRQPCAGRGGSVRAGGATAAGGQCTAQRCRAAIWQIQSWKLVSGVGDAVQHGTSEMRASGPGCAPVSCVAACMRCAGAHDLHVVCSSTRVFTAQLVCWAAVDEFVLGRLVGSVSTKWLTWYCARGSVCAGR